jgi:hypothetical protein
VRALARRHNNKMAEQPEEARWIESEWLASTSTAVNDEDDEPAMTDLFADPDPMDTFDFTWQRTDGDDNDAIAIRLEGYKAELGQTLSSTGLTLWRASELLANFLVQHEARYLQGRRVLEVSASNDE